MSSLSHRSPTIESLELMMSRLADSSLTIDEASLLRYSIHQLMDELSAVRPERTVWPEAEKGSRLESGRVDQAHPASRGASA